MINGQRRSKTMPKGNPAGYDKKPAKVKPASIAMGNKAKKMMMKKKGK